MKDILTIFVPFFLLFAIVGFISGWDKRAKTAKDKIYREAVVIKKGEHYYFEVKSESDFVYHYSIDSDSTGRMVRCLPDKEHHGVSTG